MATVVVEIATNTRQTGIADKISPAETELRWQECVRQSPLFWRLSASDHTEIAGSARELRYSQGEIIFLQNDPVHHVYVVAEGVVKVTQITEVGKETLLRLESTGGLLDDVTGSDLLHSITARALQDCRLLVWESATFDGLTGRIGRIHHNAIEIMRSRLKVLQERFCDVATRPVPQRLARLVIHLALKAPGSFAPVELSREDLAQMAGTSLFTVSRLLCAWADEDIVTVERKAVTIEDLPRLLELATAA